MIFCMKKKRYLPAILASVVLITAITVTIAFLETKKKPQTDAGSLGINEKTESTTHENKADSEITPALVSDTLRSCAIVESGGLIGSGNIWDVDDKSITVITACHVIDDRNDITVHFLPPEGTESEDDLPEEKSTANAIEIFADENSDYCLLRVDLEDHPYLDTKMLSSVRVRETLPQTNETIFLIDPETKTGSAGIVASPSVYSEDFGCDMIYCYVTVNEGMSGSGLFDTEGKYLGMLLGGSEDNEAVILSSQEIKP